MRDDLKTNISDLAAAAQEFVRDADLYPRSGYWHELFSRIHDTLCEAADEIKKRERVAEKWQQTVKLRNHYRVTWQEAAKSYAGLSELLRLIDDKNDQRSDE